MSKSIYSLVLSDEVVSLVDRAAYQEGISRSAMVNRILAEYASCVTPEARAQGIYSRVAQALDTADRIRVQSGSPSVLMLRSALSYKYNPTVRFSVELSPAEETREGGRGVGELRVMLRSQNAQLLELFARFFSLWNWIEKMNGAPGGIWDGGGRWCRSLVLPAGKSLSDDEFAAALLAYIRLIDAALEHYFSRLESETESAFTMENLYEAYLNEGGFVFA